jgi:N6-adenosine-specific RNA methylase IME4
MRDPKSQPAIAELTAPTAVGSGDWLDGTVKYKTILADPPWRYKGIPGKGKFSDGANRDNKKLKTPYPTMTVEEICALPVGDLADDGAHLWLWTTNEHLEAGFQVMRAWGFKYLAPITWVKPGGFGCWFVHRTQTMLFGYKCRCVFNRERYKPTVLEAGNPSEHSAKPNESYELIESISDPARVEIFARPWTPMFPRRDGWDVWGNEVPQDVALVTGND